MKTRFCYLLSLGLLTLVHSTAVSLTPAIASVSSQSVATNHSNYTQLQTFLSQKQWQAADQETRRILEQWVHPNQDVYGIPRANTIPADVIRQIDQLWQQASGGRFGLSVQQRLWQQALTQHPKDINAAVKAFGDRVGWTRKTPSEAQILSPDWLTENELNYSLNAPEGHFPWVGISAERIANLVDSPGCGSCTIDAMYLQGDRFTRYIPALYSQVQTALNTPSQPSVQAWQDLQLRHQIDLQTLYPNNGCPVYPLDQAISPNSQIVAVSSYSYERACGGGPNNSTLTLWNTQRGTRIITLLRGQAMESFSYSGQAQEPPTEQTRIVGDVANAIAFTPDSRIVAAGLSNGTIRLWTTDTGKAVRTLSGHRYAVRTIDISPDGQFLVSGSSDQTIKVWNLSTGKLLQTISLKPSDGILHQVTISPDGRRLATATTNNKLQLWELPTGRLLRTFVDETVTVNQWLPITFSPNGELLATGDIDSSVKLWKTSTGARLITLKGHTKNVQSLAFSPDSRTLASSSQDNTVRLWNLQTYSPTQTLNIAQSAGHPATPTNLGYLEFSADGQVLATSALLLPIVESEPIPRQGLRLWNVKTGQSIHDIHNVSTFELSPNNQFLITRGETLRIWQP